MFSRKSKVDGMVEGLTEQLDELRDRAAAVVGTDDARSGGWGGRLLWLGAGIGIGVAAAGGRLVKLLPKQVADRVVDLTDQVGSAAEGLTDKVGSAIGGDDD